MEKSEKLDCIPHTHIGGWWDIYMIICVYIYTCIDIDIAIVRIPIGGRMTKNIQTILRHGTYTVTPISRCHLPGINQSCRTPCQTAYFNLIFFHKLGYSKIQRYLSTSFPQENRQKSDTARFNWILANWGQPWIGTWIRTIFVCNIKLTLIGTYIYMVGSINEGSPIAGWFIFFAMENPITMDDIEVSQF